MVYLIGIVILKPLQDLVKAKDVAGLWEDKHTTVMNQMITEMKKPLRLIHPNFQRPFVRIQIVVTLNV